MILQFRVSRLSRWLSWSASTHPPSCWRETPAPGPPRGPRCPPGCPAKFWLRWLCRVSDPTALYEVCRQSGRSPGSTWTPLSHPPLPFSLTRRQGWSHRKLCDRNVIIKIRSSHDTCSQMWGCDSQVWSTVCRETHGRKTLGLQSNLIRRLNILTLQHHLESSRACTQPTCRLRTRIQRT